MRSLALAGVGFVVGVIAGAFIGRDATHRVLSPLTTASGQQAHLVLTLLDRKDEATLRRLMELEVDSALMSLRAIETSRGFSPGDPELRVYGMLKAYREAHPAGGTTQPAVTAAPSPEVSGSAAGPASPGPIRPSDRP